MLKFALAIFTGAFLLFQVQPLIGKYILPWFGGTPAVWTSCMLFFQLLLLAGYAYAHVSTRRLSARAQAVLHLALLLAAVALLPITPSNAWKPHDSGYPVWRIMTLLAVSVGLPYFVLSATGPLLQDWFRRMHPGRSPFRLYALSNLASLLALVSYPFWFEIEFSRQAQAAAWSWGMGVFVLLCGYCAVRVWKSNWTAPAAPEAALSSQEENVRPGFRRYLLWLALPACASVLLLATTNKLCLDVAVIPFLWVLPLSLYLLTFIISFDSPRWYSRVGFGIALGPTLGAMVWALDHGDDASLIWQVVLYGAALFVCGMVCHGELYRLRPAPRYLTAYYLMIAAGGALGGLFVGVVAPLAFNTYVELHWGLALCLFLFLAVCVSDREALGTASWRALALFYGLAAWIGVERLVAWSGNWLKNNPTKLPLKSLANLNWNWAQHVHWLVAVAFVALVARGVVRKTLFSPRNWHLRTCLLVTAGFLVLGVALARESWLAGRGALNLARNFYGVLCVWDYRQNEPEQRHLLLQHGRITHGLQFLDPESSKRPTTYYVEESGVGLALRHFPRSQDRVIGVVGLGTGTLAAYGRKGDRLRFYEINPEVERVARNRFTYLKQCPAQVEVVLGDARLSMERERPQQFDVLALDAFSSDAIPVHLLTREAFDIYLRHLKPDGVIAVHISNHYLNLTPVVNNLAAHFQLKRLSVSEGDPFDDDEGEWWRYASTWVLLTRNQAFLDLPAIREARTEPEKPGIKIPLWTDDCASLFPILE
jgi:SAM-dependent methyltransferase